MCSFIIAFVCYQQYSGLVTHSVSLFTDPGTHGQRTHFVLFSSQVGLILLLLSKLYEFEQVHPVNLETVRIIIVLFVQKFLLATKLLSLET